MYRNSIHCAGFEALFRINNKRRLQYHVAHYNRGRGQRMYLCGCGKDMFIDGRRKICYMQHGRKRITRSKYNIKI